MYWILIFLLLQRIFIGNWFYSFIFTIVASVVVVYISCWCIVCCCCIASFVVVVSFLMRWLLCVYRWRKCSSKENELVRYKCFNLRSSKGYLHCRFNFQCSVKIEDSWSQESVRSLTNPKKIDIVKKKLTCGRLINMTGTSYDAATNHVRSLGWQRSSDVRQKRSEVCQTGKNRPLSFVRCRYNIHNNKRSCGRW